MLVFAKSALKGVYRGCTYLEHFPARNTKLRGMSYEEIRIINGVPQ